MKNKHPSWIIMNFIVGIIFILIEIFYGFYVFGILGGYMIGFALASFLLLRKFKEEELK